MTNDGWTGERSPFHRGEQQVQARLGVRDRLEGFGRRMIRDHMPDQHREFYGLLSFLLLGTADEEGRPWASIVAGPPGFVSSPDPRRLRIAAGPLEGDPLQRTLRDGADVGVLGIQLETRRRNRLSGTVRSVGPGGFEISVRQSFGNCPQYIQTRSVALRDDGAAGRRPIHRGDRLDAAARALIERSDTFFIATIHADGSGDAATGADVSHRGGRPGFVRVEDDHTLSFPDFSGNLHFNTIGNILLNPKAGLLFFDFERGDLLYLTGSAEVVWQGEEVRAFVGAERLLRVRVDETIRVEGSLPLRFAFGEFSPSLDGTGSWRQALETIEANRTRDVYHAYEVVDVVGESETISSFHLRRADGRALADYRPGQFLPIRLTIPGRPDPVLRTYTVSDAADSDHYRLSIKREDTGLVSRYFHDHVRPGFRLEAMAPRGQFFLDPGSERPVVLISGGVGITPMIAIANHLIAEGRRTRTFRRIHFVHGTTNGRAQAFGRHLRGLARAHPSLSVHIRFSRPQPEDRLGETHDSVGRIDIDLLRSLLPSGDCDVYLCGPGGFMQSLYDDLIGLGVPDGRIFAESFGPARLIRRASDGGLAAAASTASREPVSVRFAASGIEAMWSPEKGTLLELAEASGLSPPFGCRSGACGTCATKIACGGVDYVREPVGPHGDDEVLICSATPRSATGARSCGGVHGVVLDL